MTSVFRPIRGFGVWGWVLLFPLGWLVYCAMGGFDLRHAILEFCYHRFGGDAVWEVILNHILFGAYLGSMVGIIAGPITLIPVLIAMHFSPRRWAWWQWWCVGLWLIFNPWLCLQMARLVRPGWAVWAGWVRPQGITRVVYNGEVLGVVVAQLVALTALAWIIVRPLHTGEQRSRWRWSPAWMLALGLLIGTFLWWADLSMNLGTFLLPPSVWYVSAAVWHAGFALLLICGAVVARRRAAAEMWRCGTCGYDRRGLAPAAAVCPECGDEVASA